MGKIANENEILEMYTSIMRRDVMDYVKDGHDIVDVPVKPADMMKAGDALLKRFDAAEQPAAEENCAVYGVVMMPEVKEQP